MTVRSDDGQCEFNVVQPDSKNNFISFGIATVPEHDPAIMQSLLWPVAKHLLYFL